ncbi:MAG: hypothetical protein NTX97_05425 [Bacteroidetes bacterium]|nr:hypothetical protein [Bacteroidota bacterium]
MEQRNKHKKPEINPSPQIPVTPVTAPELYPIPNKNRPEKVLPDIKPTILPEIKPIIRP